jgi:hypothetical protein
MYLFETLHRINTRPVIFAGLLWLIFTQAGFSLPVDSVTVVPQNKIAGASCIYQIRFTLEQEILPDAMILVTFPPSFDLSEVLIAGSATINGGFQVAVNQLTVSIKRSGLGRRILPNEKVDLRFANVKNPMVLADNYNIRVRVQNSAGRMIVDKVQSIKIEQKN